MIVLIGKILNKIYTYTSIFEVVLQWWKRSITLPWFTYFECLCLNRQQNCHCQRKSNLSPYSNSFTKLFIQSVWLMISYHFFRQNVCMILSEKHRIDENDSYYKLKVFFIRINLYGLKMYWERRNRKCKKNFYVMISFKIKSYKIK